MEPNIHTKVVTYKVGETAAIVAAVLTRMFKFTFEAVEVGDGTYNVLAISKKPLSNSMLASLSSACIMICGTLTTLKCDLHILKE